jgi:hypothetical protein
MRAMASRPLLIPSAIPALASTPSVMRAMLAPLPDDLIAAPGREGWSARDVVAHLAARQGPAIVGRISAMLAEDGAAIPNVPDDLMEVEPYRALPLDALLREFAEGREAAVATLRTVTPDQYSRTGIHSEVGLLTIADVIHHVAYHDLVHVSQAARLVSRPLERLRGALRVYR